MCYRYFIYLYYILEVLIRITIYVLSFMHVIVKKGP